MNDLKTLKTQEKCKNNLIFSGTFRNYTQGYILFVTKFVTKLFPDEYENNIFI